MSTELEQLNADLQAAEQNLATLQARRLEILDEAKKAAVENLTKSGAFQDLNEALTFIRTLIPVKGRAGRPPGTKKKRGETKGKNFRGRAISIAVSDMEKRRLNVDQKVEELKSSGYSNSKDEIRARLEKAISKREK